MKMNIIFLGTDSIMKFYFQTLFYNLLVFEYSLVHIFWQGLNMFFYFISKRIASEFSCKKCISFT